MKKSEVGVAKNDVNDKGDAMKIEAMRRETGGRGRRRKNETKEREKYVDKEEEGDEGRGRQYQTWD